MQPWDFTGRRAVVTGAGSGIGLATTELLVGRGAQVVACDVASDRLERAAAAGAQTVAADLATADGRGRLVAEAGACDLLVVAHGIVRPKPIAETREEDWDAIFAVNAKAVYFLCQAFGQAISDGGAVVVVSSVSARIASSLEQSVYAASKAATSSIVRSFAYELAPRGIRVNAVLPGIVETPMQQSLLDCLAEARGESPEEIHAARLARVPLGRTSPPAECAETIVWLLGAGAGYVTGQQITADGGLTMF